MSAKDVRFSSDARNRMLRGLDILNNAVKATPEAMVAEAPKKKEPPAMPPGGMGGMDY